MAYAPTGALTVGGWIPGAASTVGNQTLRTVVPDGLWQGVAGAWEPLPGAQPALASVSTLLVTHTGAGIAGTQAGVYAWREHTG